METNEQTQALEVRQTQNAVGVLFDKIIQGYQVYANAEAAEDARRTALIQSGSNSAPSTVTTAASPMGGLTQNQMLMVAGVIALAAVFALRK